MVNIVALFHVVQHKCTLCCHFSCFDCGMHFNICVFHSTNCVVHAPEFWPVFIFVCKALTAECQSKEGNHIKEQ